ncbi:MAG: AMP-binding protein, partial [bacterium]|nr:AMP-binding protein [bacterium]
AEYPRGKTIHQLFEEQVEKTPDSIGLVGSRQSTPSTPKTPLQKPQSRQAHAVTYRELNEKANRLARHLQSKGVEPGTIVAIMLERSIEMIIGLLGILKAGGTYLPIEPGYPQERIDYMLKDSNARLLLVDNKSETPIFKSETKPNDQNLNDQNQKERPVVLNLEHLAFEYLESEFVSDFEFRASDFPSPAYIIYTSGTTGKPKGVLIEHRGVLRLITGTNYIEISGDDRLLLTGAFVFDITTFEIWGPMLNGAGLYLVPKEHILDAVKLEIILTKNKISILHLIPQLFNQVAQQNPRVFAGLSTFLVGGDQVVP